MLVSDALHLPPVVPADEERRRETVPGPTAHTVPERPGMVTH